MILLLLGACSDTAVGKFNGEPSAAILSHEDGDPVLEGATVAFTGSVSDPDDPETGLAVTWSINGVVACEGFGESGGGSTCEMVIPDGSAEVLLEVHDPGGAAASEKVTLDVIPLESPVVTITTPANGARTYSDQPLELAGTAVDADDAAEHLDYTWTTPDGELAAGTVDSTDSFSDVVFLPAGNQTLTVTVTDDDGNSANASVGVVVNGPDTAPTCAISSPADGSISRAGDDVLLQGIVTDAEEAADALAVTWTSDRDGTLYTGAPDTSGNTTATTPLSAGTHVVTLSGTDEVGLGCSDTVVLVVGSPPTVAFDAPLDGDSVGEADLLDVGLTVGDDDGAVEDLSVTLRSDVEGILGVFTPDSSGEVLWSTTGLSVGAHTLTATATDPTALSGTASVRVTINGTPTSPTVSISPTSPTTVDDLVGSASGATDPEGDPLSYTWEWWVDGTYVTTGATLSASDTTRGDTWELRVSVSDGVSSSVEGTASVVILNSPPSASAATISPLPATSSDVLGCVATGFVDADGDADASTIVWSIDGATIGTGATLASGFARGDVVTCTITPSDGLDSGAPVSASTTIDNAVPVATAVSISPASPTTTDTLTASATGSDADGDSVTFTYAWYVNGTLAGTGAALAASASDNGDSVYVTGTPSDTVDTGDTVASATVTIANSAPTAPTVTIDPVDPLAGIDDLTCEVTSAAADADGDSVSYTMSWTRDGAAYTGATTIWSGDTVPASATTEGELWVCTATPSDGSTTGATGTDSVTIGAGGIDYSDTWTLDRTVSYTCAFTLVSINFSTMRIADSYPDVDVTVSGNPGTMSGTFPTADTIDVSHSLPGTCTETYTMAGTFLDENTFNGSFTASYSPSSACFGCSSQSWIFSATR